MGNFAKHCDDSSRMEKDGESHKPMRCELSARSFRKEANNPLGRSAKKRRRPSAIMTRTPPRAFQKRRRPSAMMTRTPPRAFHRYLHG